MEFSLHVFLIRDPFWLFAASCANILPCEDSEKVERENSQLASFLGALRGHNFQWERSFLNTERGERGTNEQFHAETHKESF